ncbi:MAG: hypothetical protein ACPGQD_03425 [Planctomycetota bacterium]
MVKIDLKTHNGAEVATIEIPPFRDLPRVVRWGTRTFYRRDKSLIALRQTPVYHEVFAFDVPIQGDGRD